MSVFVGTSGWDYPEWRGHFYPEDLSRTRFLRYYADVFGSCELNATFRGRQTERSVARWFESTPNDFVFCAKAHMRITHRKQMTPDAETRAFMAEFIASLSGLGNKLGVVLLQIPAFRERDDDGLASLLDALPSGPRYAFDFRHDSWDHSGVRQLLAEAKAGSCLADDSGDAPGSVMQGRFGYIRLRASGYTDEQRQAWLRLLRNEGTNGDLFVFARHKGIDPGANSAGVDLASWLQRRLAEEKT